MKKIVSIIIALVSLINVNAQRVEMNYENTFEPIFEISNISARGTANITLNYSDVIVSINCTGFAEFSNKGVVIDDDHNCLEFVGDIEEEGAATFTVSLSDNAKQANKYIKKITFITRGNSDITSVIGSNDAGSDTDVKFVGTNRIAIESGFDKISEFEIDFTYNDYVQLKSIMVEYGYFDDELTLTDDSYDYFGDYRYAKKVTYTRPMNSEKWGSLCLPFNYVVDDSKFSVYSIKGAGLNGSNAPITLSKVANGTEVVAGTPMFVYCTEPNLVVSAENVLLTTEDFNSSGLIYEYGTTEVIKDGNNNPISPSLNYTFYGTMKNVTVTDAIFVENDIFKYINGTAKTFQPYRAYFTLEGNNSGTGSLTFRVLNGSNLTSVAGVCGAEGHETDVKWELTDMDNNGSLETITISGTGAMKNYNNNQPWAAFKSGLTTVVIGDGVTSIGFRAFYQFTALTSVSIASSVTDIYASAFSGCTNLATINGASGVTYVESFAFDGTAWRSNLPGGLTYVGHVAYMFKGDGTSVTIDAGTTQIYNSCFNMSKITSIIIPASVKSIGNNAFESAKITSIIIPDGVTSIGNYAFHNSALTSVIIPASVTSIGNNAFAYSAPQKIYVLRSGSNVAEITQLGSSAFEGCNNLSAIVVPADAYGDYNNRWSSYRSKLTPGYTVTCNDGITATTTNNGPLVEQDETVTLSYTGEVPTGCDVRYSIDGGTTLLVGNTFTMPNANVTVSAVLNGPDQPFVVTTWDDLMAKMALGGYIRLDADATTSGSSGSYLIVPEGVTVTLDLNGHTIDQNKYSSNRGIWVEGALTLNDSGTGGTITGGKADTYTDTYNSSNVCGFGAGVFVAKTGLFTMNGGTISGNTAESGGGGVYVANSDKPLASSAPSWYGDTGYTMQVNTSLSIDLKRQVKGYTSPYVSIYSTWDDNSDPIASSTYSINDDDIFTFTPTTTGIYTFYFKADNSNGTEEREITITVGDDPVAPPTDPAAPSGGTFIMNGGTISGNKTDYDGGGVYVEDGCTFTMNGGTISGNTANYDGGGVYANWGATFNLNGGSISGNQASNGCGVYVKNSKFNVSGSPVITGNVDIDGDANNVYLPEGKTIKVSGALNADARIGVTTKQEPSDNETVTITSGLSGKGTRANFLSDNDAYGVMPTASGELALAKVVLKSGAVEILEDQNGRHAIIDGNYSGSDAIKLDEDVEVADVTFNRTFPIDKDCTIVLPFEVSTDQLSGVDYVLSFAGIVEENGMLECAMQVVWENNPDENVDLQAYTPYIVRTNSSNISITGGVMFKATRDAFTEKDNWEYRGIYSYKMWEQNSLDLGTVYGFAANKVEEDKIEIGDFVRVSAGAYIYPLRAYLIYKEEQSNAPRRASALDELPDRIPVRVIHLDGSVTKLTTTDFTDFTDSDAWYTVNGMKLSGKPTKAGLYIVNGKKVVIH